jgi:tRNA-binding protein
MTERKSTIDPEVFFSADLRVGTVIQAEYLPKARVPAIAVTVDFGDIGVLRSSARITKRYTPEQMLGSQVIAVVNFPPRQIGSMMSECLILGAVGDNGDVVLLRPEFPSNNGQSIS